MWDDNGMCEPDRARARAYPCCSRPPRGSTGCAHDIVHKATVPLLSGGEMIVAMLPEDDEHEDWIMAVHGQVLRYQPSPVPERNDVWIERADGQTLAVMVSDGELPDDARAPLIREFLTLRKQASAVEPLRGLCLEVRRPDPLFRLVGMGRRLWFDARWPLPDPDLPLRALTGSRVSAGWTDLTPAHEFLQHVRALDSAEALAAALFDSKSGRWGGIVLTRGGGGRPGEAAEWVAMFNDPGVIDAVSEVQEAGIPVLAAIGHELDRTWVEEVADYSWPTPSALAGTLSRWRAYLYDELRSPDDGLRASVYAAGRSIRDEFDDAWLRARSGDPAAARLVPQRRWNPA